MDTLDNNDLTHSTREEDKNLQHRVLLSQAGKLFLSGFPDVNYIELPKLPQMSVTHVNYYDTNNMATTFPSSNYVVDTHNETVCIVLKSGYSWPSSKLRGGNSVEVQFVCNYRLEAMGVSMTNWQGMLLMIGSLHDNRKNEVVGIILDLPQQP
jgi:hypothetical protein